MNAEDKILAAKTALMWDHPFFGVLVTQLLLVEVADEKVVNTMATDGTHLYWHRKFVDGLKIKELVFVLAHEVMHNAMKHHTRQQHRAHRKWDIACDYAINGDLIESKVGSPPKDILVSAAYTGLSAEAIYNQLPEDGDGAGGRDPGGCGGVMPAAKPGDHAALAQAEIETDVRIRQAAMVARGKAAGKLPAGVERLIETALAPKVDWRAALRRFIDESMTSDYSWSRPNKRLLPHGFYLPSLVPDGVRHIVVAVDTSGSVNGPMLEEFAAEVSGAFNDGAVDKATVVYADAAVQRHDEFTAGDELRIMPMGGGGTRFDRTFEWIEDHADDASVIIYLTDMECSAFGEQPKAPVIWAVHGDQREFERRAAKAPFGECIPLTL